MQIANSLFGSLALFFTIGCPTISYAEAITQEEMQRYIYKVVQECEEPGQILAEARLNKYRKTGKDVEAAFRGKAYETVSAVMKQQCVSVNLVVILRKMKSLLSAEESMKLNLDAEINKHMSLIEQSL